MFNQFFKGFSFVFIGRRTVKEVRGLFYWILIPFLLDLVILGLGAYFGLSFVNSMAIAAIGWLFSGAESIFSQIVYYPVLLLLSLGFLVTLVYFTYVVASVIASPFYSIIAEKTLIHFKIIDANKFNAHQFLKQTASMLIVSLKRAFILLIIGVFLFLFSFIPILNILAAYVAFVLMAMDSADFAMEARGLVLKQRLSYFKQNYKLFLGQGAFVGLTLVIPGLILLVMPYAVIGSTVLMVENEHSANGKKSAF